MAMGKRNQPEMNNKFGIKRYPNAIKSRILCMVGVTLSTGSDILLQTEFKEIID
jgi:hypothetical protein